MSGNDAKMEQTSFNICMPEAEAVWVVFLISPCYNSCSAKTQ